MRIRDKLMFGVGLWFTYVNTMVWFRWATIDSSNVIEAVGLMVFWSAAGFTLMINSLEGITNTLEKSALEDNPPAGGQDSHLGEELEDNPAHSVELIRAGRAG